MQLEQVLENTARRLPDKTALVCGARRLSYAEIDQAANTLAHNLIANGVLRGDRVAVFLDNSVEAVISVFAILKAGAVMIVVNPTTRADKLAYLLNDSRAVAVITDPLRLRTLMERWNGAPHLSCVWVAGRVNDSVVKRMFSLTEVIAAGAGGDRPPRKENINLDLAALNYTSGSTGRPKGVMLTHLNMTSALTSIGTYLENSDRDVILSVLPLSFNYGIYQLLVTFHTGGTLVLEKSFTYPQAILKTMRIEQVTGFALAPTIAAILLQMDLAKQPLPDLRFITNAAAALPVHHLLELHKSLPHVRIFPMYGQTECGRISYLEPEQVELRPASVGRGMPNEELYLVDAEDRRLGPGVAGQLVVRGAHVAAGYWDDPETSARVFRPGPMPGERLLYTGDLFRMDAEGYLYFISRQDEIIKTRGEKVSPKEVEDVLHAIPGIAEAAVIGVPDSMLGQAVKAVITVREGSTLDAQTVLRHCTQRLEPFMVPKFVEFIKSMPKTMSGKILKRELAEAAHVGVK